MRQRSARYYDAIYGETKDYRADARMLHLWIQARAAGARTLLDVACGTGLHLQYLKEWYEAEGLDISEAMLAVARERNPDLTLYQAEMADFDLGRRFDVITCLFSAIGYADGVDGLQRVFGNFARHLVPGGLCIVEPWLTPKVWMDGRLNMNTVDRPDLKLARMVETERDGPVVLLKMHHLVLTPGGVEQFSDTHRTFLFTATEYESALRSAGFAVEFDPDGFIGRGMYFGTLAG